MNKNINLYEILKGLEGIELYSSVYGYVTLTSVEPYGIYVKIKEEKYFPYLKYFTTEGFIENYPDAECTIFPSKEQRDWSKFEIPKPVLAKHSLVYYKIYKSDFEWKVGFYNEEGSIFITNYESNMNIRNAELIVPHDKINKDDLSYKECNNYGMPH